MTHIIMSFMTIKEIVPLAPNHCSKRLVLPFAQWLRYVVYCTLKRDKYFILKKMQDNNEVYKDMTHYIYKMWRVYNITLSACITLWKPIPFTCLPWTLAVNNFTKYTHSIYNMNVREYRRGNQKWTIQRNWQHVIWSDVFI